MGVPIGAPVGVVEQLNVDSRINDVENFLPNKSDEAFKLHLAPLASGFVDAGRQRDICFARKVCEALDSVEYVAHFGQLKRRGSVRSLRLTGERRHSKDADILICLGHNFDFQTNLCTRVEEVQYERNGARPVGRRREQASPFQHILEADGAYAGAESKA
jgi:hypothetical protein